MGIHSWIVNQLEILNRKLENSNVDIRMWIVNKQIKRQEKLRKEVENEESKNNKRVE